MEGILNKENDKWIVQYKEHFRTVKDHNGIFVGQEYIVRSIPVVQEEAKLLTNDSEGKEIDFRIGHICPFDFTSRCTLGRCDCDEVAESVKILSKD